MKKTPTIAKTKTLHQTYDSIADNYGKSIAIINAFHGKFYIKNMPRNRGSVLDIGCGTGDILAQISKYFKQSFGIDPIKKFVASALQRSPESTIKTGNAENLPFKDGSMDYIISHIVFQHVDRDRAVEEVLRVLKPGGRLIISEVLSSHASLQTPIATFYKRALFNYFLLSRHGMKQTKHAKEYQASSAWKELTFIHRARRFDLTELQQFYSNKLPGAKFKSLDTKVIAVIWDKS